MLGSGWKWINVWDIIDILTQVMQVICTIVYLLKTGMTSRTFNVMLASQTILLIAKIQFFARLVCKGLILVLRVSCFRAFVAVESSMLDTLKAVIGGIKWYLLLLVLTIYSFACAFFILYRTDYRDCEVFDSFWNPVFMLECRISKISSTVS